MSTCGRNCGRNRPFGQRVAGGRPGVYPCAKCNLLSRFVLRDDRDAAIPVEPSDQVDLPAGGARNDADAERDIRPALVTGGAVLQRKHRPHVRAR